MDLAATINITDPIHFHRDAVASWIRTLYRHLVRDASRARDALENEDTDSIADSERDRAAITRVAASLSFLQEQYELIDRFVRKLPLNENEQGRVRQMLAAFYAHHSNELLRRRRGGPHPKLGVTVTVEDMIKMARVADSPPVKSIATIISGLSERDDRYLKSTEESVEFRSLSKEQRRVVSRLLSEIPKLSRRDRQPASLAAFIAQFLCGLPVDVYSTARNGNRKIPNGWFYPGQAVKFVRQGRASRY